MDTMSSKKSWTIWMLEEIQKEKEKVKKSVRDHMENFPEVMTVETDTEVLKFYDHMDVFRWMCELRRIVKK